MKERAYLERNRGLSEDDRKTTWSSQDRFPKKIKVKWRFRPKSFKVVITWGFTLFILVKVLLIPLTGGLVKYIVASRELRELKAENQRLDSQLGTMVKERDYMLTPSYIEERGHQIGMLKENERQMVVVDAAEDEDLRQLLARRRKPVEIGD